MFTITSADLVWIIGSIGIFLFTTIKLLGSELIKKNEQRFKRVEKSIKHINASIRNIELALSARGVAIRAVLVEPDEDEDSYDS